ncbi:DUF805 domain-containing protein [Vibrio genomosp. F6]|uniref:DUF805 domain-containing protein n=1 Tax=Vibrio genomosp. F6 str. FF-238 TaxID=1191298 RepID=A0A1E5CLQ1_9VIBR|nr:DUF805 domain-containing protein [Vibrio genomosp. F6]OEE69608.1 hypothetical protein A130_09190 [Vibrio genomosp. F6 str. FF-238]
MNWYITVIKKYATFSGRSRRKEHWYFFLFNILIGIVLGFTDAVMGNVTSTSGYGLLGSIYSLALLIPGIAVGVRRLHDTGRTGWWLLIALIPIIGVFVLLYFTASKGDVGSNKYGYDPKGLNA